MHKNVMYQAGSYYDYLQQVVETSLNHFLEDTEFPYTVESGKGGPGGFGGRGGGVGRGDENAEGRNGNGIDRMAGGADGEGLNGELPDGMDADEAVDYYALDGIDRTLESGGVSLSGTYETAEDYIAALNQETEWVIYDSDTNTAEITSIADFVCALKNASKSLGAFDALDESQGENVLFGDGDGEGDHFDQVMARLLVGTEYEKEFSQDLARIDYCGNSVEYRVNMYNPLYYLNAYYEGYKTANVASFWRIRTGINQSDTALTTEVNLALALKNYGAEVDFETVWGQGHVEAERTGDSSENFIAWVKECCQNNKMNKGE